MQPLSSPAVLKTRKARLPALTYCLVILALLAVVQPQAAPASAASSGAPGDGFFRICEPGEASTECTHGRVNTRNQRLLAAQLYPGRPLYRVQSGDSLAVVAARFAVSPDEIDSLGDPLPSQGLLKPGQLLVLPASLAAWQPVARLLPDSAIVYGPASGTESQAFDVAAYLEQAGGALNTHQEYLASSGWTTAAAIVERVALENSINPRLLLALLEQQCACVLGPQTTGLESGYALGVVDHRRKGLYGQLWWAANQLSTGYYGWREGWLLQVDLPDGSSLQPAPDLNAASLALQVYFASLWAAHDQSRTMGALTWQKLHPDSFESQDYWLALDPQEGFPVLYRQMFGDPWMEAWAVEPLLPDGLLQPELSLPFEPGRLWAYTSGPHRAWEMEGSRAALDFAPASNRPGCQPTDALVLAVASGKVARVGPGLLVQDLDGAQPSDGREQTGWAIIYMHVDHQDKLKPGDLLQAGDPLGKPSCLGGRSTGTHLHLARKYNGEWIAAGGPLPFVLSGWITQAGAKPYEGTLVKDGQVVIAHPYANFETNIRLPVVDGTGRDIPTPTPRP